MKKILFLLFIPIFANAATYYVHPTLGIDSNPGTLAQPFKTLTKLSQVLVQGDIAYLRGGTYTSTNNNATYHFQLSNLTGTAGSPIRIMAYQSEVPVFDLSNIVPGVDYPFAFAMTNCQYVYLTGKIIVKNLRQVAGGAGISRGFWLSQSDNCRVEFVEVFNCNYGFLLENGSDNNYLLNCDGHHNGDGVSDGGADAWDNADGFGITSSNGTNSSTGNTFDGCRAWLNSDDGWDFFGINGIQTIKNCRSFWNGFKPWGTSNTQPNEAQMTPGTYATFHNVAGYIAGSGEGIKLGPNFTATISTTNRFLQNCVSFENRGSGYASNSDGANTGRHQIYNSIAYKNDNDGFGYCCDWATGVSHIFKNNWSYLNNVLISGEDFVYGGNCTGSISNNRWQSAGSTNCGNLGITASAADFVSVSSAGQDGARGSGGTLPVSTYLNLVAGSDLRNAGTNVGIAYCDSNPDLGAFEYCTGGDPLPTAEAGGPYNVILPTTQVTMTGVATGTSTTVAWTRFSGPNTPGISGSTTNTPTLTGLVGGTYKYVYTVTDGSLNTDVDTAIISVTDNSQILPAAVFMRGVVKNGSTRADVLFTAGPVKEGNKFVVWRRGTGDYTNVGTINAVSGVSEYKGTYSITSATWTTFKVQSVVGTQSVWVPLPGEVKKN